MLLLLLSLSRFTFRVSGIVLLIHEQTLPILSCFALSYLSRSM